jgi:hypothetical protein
MVLLAYQQHGPGKTELAYRTGEYAGRVACSGNQQINFQRFALHASVTRLAANFGHNTVNTIFCKVTQSSSGG